MLAKVSHSVAQQEAGKSRKPVQQSGRKGVACSMMTPQREDGWKVELGDTEHPEPAKFAEASGIRNDIADGKLSQIRDLVPSSWQT